MAVTSFAQEPLWFAERFQPSGAGAASVVPSFSFRDCVARPASSRRRFAASIFSSSRRSFCLARLSGQQPKPQGIAAMGLDDLVERDHVAEVRGHLLARGVADHRTDDDVTEGRSRLEAGREEEDGRDPEETAGRRRSRRCRPPTSGGIHRHPAHRRGLRSGRGRSTYCRSASNCR